MTLPPFQTSTAAFSSSIALDASTVVTSTVTIAIHTTRQQELEILRSIYGYGTDIGFKPFYHKANQFEHTARRPFCERLLAAY